MNDHPELKWGVEEGVRKNGWIDYDLIPVKLLLPHPFNHSFFSLISELKAEKKRRFNVRQSLEDSWRWSIQEKQHRLAEELQEARDPSLLLHQQCEKYARCKQCQRSRTNKGQSNILHESRYISGARMMVWTAHHFIFVISSCCQSTATALMYCHYVLSM